MKSIRMIFVLICSYSLLSAQSIEFKIPVLPQGNISEALNNYVNYSEAVNPGNLMLINPAALTNYKQLIAGFSYRFSNKIEKAWPGEIGYGKNQKNYPDDISFIIPLDNFVFGLAFSQRYNASLDLGKVKISSAENPDGIGEITNSKYESYMNEYSLTAAYVINFNDSKSKLAFGIKFNNDDLYHKEEIINPGFSKQLHSTSWAVGVNYKQYFNTERYFQLGLTYENELKFSKRFNWTTVNPYVDSLNQKITYDVLLTGRFPATIKLDYDIQVEDGVNVTGNLLNTRWNDLYKGIDNSFSFSTGIIYKLNDLLKFNAGFLRGERKYKQGSGIDYLTKDLNAIYLTAGCAVDLRPVILNFSVSDSHLNSGRLRKQTIAGAGIYYNLL